jgi:hypothetical protein
MIMEILYFSSVNPMSERSHLFPSILKIESMYSPKEKKIRTMAEVTVG